MPMISSIKKFLRLDKAVLNLDNEFTDAAGFYLAERKELMKEEFKGCLVGDSYTAHCKHDGHHLLHQPVDCCHG
jgi:dsDNA-binding SOS-regulon protein